MMKTNKFINKILAVGLLFGSMGLASCEDFLTLSPSNMITEDDFWKSKTDVDNVRAAAYRQMASDAVTSRILYWGELRSDNLALNDMTKTGIQHLQQGILVPTEDIFDWSSFYTGINYCNLVLSQGDIMTQPGKEVDPSFRLSDWKPMRAEVKALRALYYFYLVRAYRDVPYNTTPIRTDVEARANKLPATKGVNLLGTLIRDLDTEGQEEWQYAPDNYGSLNENVGRFTKTGIHALLADMYLWRGCMLLKSKAKGDYVLDENGDTIASAQLDNLSKECFKKSIVHADSVLNHVRREYDKEMKQLGGSFVKEQSNFTALDNEYPYMTTISSYTTSGTDVVYFATMGKSSSMYEHILQLKYNSTSGESNGTPGSYLASNNNGSVKVGAMVGSSTLTSSAASSYNVDRGFGKCDIRLLETFDYKTSSASQPICHKYLMTNLNIDDYEDVTKGCDASYSTNADANWSIYRLSDIMLIKAEAIARSLPSSTKASTTKTDAGYALVEGFNLVNAIFARCNPKMKATDSYGKVADLRSDRLRDDYATHSGNVKSADDLLKLVYNERQREFVAEGKRWFDIVRQCEATNANTDVLTNYITLSTTVRNRLKALYSLYNPIYSEEMKVNGVDYGGKLEQNPVWKRYSDN